MTIDLFSIDKIRVGRAVPDPAKSQIAEILGHPPTGFDYVRGKGTPNLLESAVDYIFVWNINDKKWERSHRLSDLQRQFLKEQL